MSFPNRLYKPPPGRQRPSTEPTSGDSLQERPHRTTIHILPPARSQLSSTTAPVAGPSNRQFAPVEVPDGTTAASRTGGSWTPRRRPPLLDSRPSVRIRRAPASSFHPRPLNAPSQPTHGRPGAPEDDWEANRRRSSSEPQRPVWVPRIADDGAPLAKATTGATLPPLREDALQPQEFDPASTPAAFPPSSSVGAFTRATNSVRSIFGSNINAQRQGAEYDAELVDLLDAVDPEVATLSSLTNVQNSLFVPDLGRLVDRRPIYNLTRVPTELIRASSARPQAGADQKPADEETAETRPQLTHSSTITSTLSESRYAVLPHGTRLEGWSQEEKDELNDHVRHMLHSKRSALRRGMRGFGQYVRRPLGFFITLYATLITLFGAAWVIFLIGWINLGSKRLYVINVIDNVLVALFAIMGDGLAPFRAVDTYHMIYIAHYHHLTWRLRKEQKLPQLENRNDLPAKQPDEIDLENMMVDEIWAENSGRNDREYNEYGVELSEKKRTEFSVLTPAQQKKLQHHQARFAKSHTFYKPHETPTHYAFPLRLLVAIVVLLDCHSLFQIALGACTWSISYHTRPFALTTVILCCSITVNITAGVLIMIGDRRTRKKIVLETMFRQELTSDAMKKIADRKSKDYGVRDTSIEHRDSGINSISIDPAPAGGDDGVEYQGTSKNK